MQFNADTKFTRVNSLSSLTTLEAPGGSSGFKVHSHELALSGNSLPVGTGTLVSWGWLVVPDCVHQQPSSRAVLSADSSRVPPYLCLPAVD